MSKSQLISSISQLLYSFDYDTVDAIYEVVLRLKVKLKRGS